MHVFYLQAPRSLGDPALRHRSATVGHAVSRDLRSWEVLPDALGTPGPEGEFDDLACWTGSVIRAPAGTAPSSRGGAWHMFYTGISRADDGRVQRVGLAVSDDLLAWRRAGCLLEADPSWYEVPDGPSAAAVHWRDPWVYAEPGGGYSMLLCARAATGPPAGRGVIGRATSPDLRHWTAQPPVAAPGTLFQLEVPQLLFADGAWRILYCSMEGAQGIGVLTGPSPEGPFSPPAWVVAGGGWYAGRAIEHAGEWWLLAWKLHDGQGRFAGELGDPIRLSFASYP